MDSQEIHCPYCGEPLEIAIDWSVREQEYVEDCQVCCQPMLLRVTLGDTDGASVAVRAESD